MHGWNSFCSEATQRNQQIHSSTESSITCLLSEITRARTASCVVQCNTCFSFSCCFFLVGQYSQIFQRPSFESDDSSCRPLRCQNRNSLEADHWVTRVQSGVEIARAREVETTFLESLFFSQIFCNVSCIFLSIIVFFLDDIYRFENRVENQRVLFTRL